MMEQMVASSDGIVRDGELGIRCTLTEPAVQQEDTFLSERKARKRECMTVIKTPKYFDRGGCSGCPRKEKRAATDNCQEM